MKTTDYKALFEQSSALELVVDTDFTIIAASDELLKATKTERKNMIGKKIFEAFPDNPNDATAKGESAIRASFNRVMETKKTDTLPVTKYGIPKSGSPNEFEAKYWKPVHSPVFDEFNNVKYIIQWVVDVTENELLMARLETEKKVLKQIEDSEKRYNMMLMRSPFAFAILKGRDMVITLANDSIKQVWGKGEDIEGKPLFEVLSELEDSTFPGLLDKVYTTGIPFYGDELLAPLQRNGKMEDVYFNFVYQPYLEADETVSGVTIIAYEVTAQVVVKKALAEKHEAEQKALQRIEESNRRYYRMLMESPFGFSVMKEKDMVIAIANDLIKEFWGKGNEVEGKTLLQLLPELKDQAFPEIIDHVYTTGIPYHANEILARISHRGKMVDRYFNVVFQPHYETDETITGVTTIVYEVTEMVLARKKIEESEFRYRMLIEEASVATALYTGSEIRVQYANDIMLTYLGKDKSIIGKPLRAAAPELTGQPFLHYLDAVYSSGKPYTGVEEKTDLLVKGKLHTFYFNFTYKALRDKEGNIYGIHHMAIDVTSQVLAKKALAESEAHFRQLADLVPAKISNADAEGNVTYFNKHWLDFSGCDFEELRDFGYHKIMHPDEVEDFQKRLQKAGETDTVLEMEMRFRNKEGKYRWHLNIATPIKDEDGRTKMWVGSTTDIHDQKTAADKIKVSEERFRLLVQQAPVAICVVRGDNYVVETVNVRMAEFWGRTIEQVLNKPIFDVLTELSDQGFEQLVDNVYNTGERFVAQELPINLIRNGKLENTFVTFVYEPLRDADGSITGVMALAHEVTDQVVARTKIEESEKKFHLLTDAMPQKITNADAEGNVLFFNQQWIDDTGLTFEELKDWGWEKSIHPEDFELTTKNWKHSVRTGEAFDMECRIQNKEGGYRWHLSRAVPIRDENGKILMWVGSNTDIHEQKDHQEALEKAVKERTKELEQTNNELTAKSAEIQKRAAELVIANKELVFQSKEKANAELTLKNTNLALIAAHERLKRFNSKLEETVDERTRELEKSNKGLLRINADLDNFIYTASHDLKAPINNIEGLVTVLLTKLPKDSREALKLIEMINHSITRFKNTLLDLSEIAKIQPDNEAELEILNFKEIASFVTEDISSLLKAADATIIEDYSKEASIKFSKKNLRSVLYNLISNAVKYRSAERKPVVEITTYKAPDDFIVLSVKDNGLGIKDEDKEKVFAMFKRLHNHVEGTGVGMSIVKRIIDNAEGKIEVESKLNVGTTFKVYFKKR